MGSEFHLDLSGSPDRQDLHRRDVRRDLEYHRQSSDSIPRRNSNAAFRGCADVDLHIVREGKPDRRGEKRGREKRPLFSLPGLLLLVVRHPRRRAAVASQPTAGCRASTELQRFPQRPQLCGCALSALGDIQANRSAFKGSNQDPIAMAAIPKHSMAHELKVGEQAEPVTAVDSRRIRVDNPAGGGLRFLAGRRKVACTTADRVAEQM
jgi:hypothetical protein